MRRVFLDLDGVIVNWYEAAFDAVGMTDREKRAMRGVAQFDTFALADNYRSVDDAINKLGSDFWERLEILPWGKELVDRVVALQLEVGFLTSGSVYPDAYKGKFAWLKKHGFDTKMLVMASSKWLAAAPGVLLVDDMDRNCQEFVGRGGSAFLWPSQYSILGGQYDVESLILQVTIAARGSWGAPGQVPSSKSPDG